MTEAGRAPEGARPAACRSGFGPGRSAYGARPNMTGMRSVPFRFRSVPPNSCTPRNRIDRVFWVCACMHMRGTKPIRTHGLTICECAIMTRAYGFGEKAGVAMGTVHVQIACDACGETFMTRIRRNTTRCPACSTPRYVPANPTWEGPDETPGHASTHPALDRDPITLDCPECGHEWITYAAPGNMVRCPGPTLDATGTRDRCRHKVRVSMRAYRASLDGPRPVERAPRPVPRSAPVRRTVPRSVPVRPAPVAASGGLTFASGLAEILAQIGTRRPQQTTPAPARPAAAAPAPAPPARPAAPPEPDRVSAWPGVTHGTLLPSAPARVPAGVTFPLAGAGTVDWLTRFGLALAPRNSRPGGLAGWCVLESGAPGREGRDCGTPRAWLVQLPDSTAVYVCTGHKDAIERGAVRARVALVAVAPLGR